MRKPHFQVLKTKSIKKKFKPKISSISKQKKDEEEQTKPDTIYNFYNNININSNIEMDESTLADIEYAKTLQLALKDAINQNEKLNEELNKCIDENKKLKDELEEKDNVIYELSQYYQYCQDNHLKLNLDCCNKNYENEYQNCKRKRKKSKIRDNKEKNNDMNDDLIVK